MQCFDLHMYSDLRLFYAVINCLYSHKLNVPFAICSGSLNVVSVAWRPSVFNRGKSTPSGTVRSNGQTEYAII